MRWIYHISSKANLSKILEHGGLLPKNREGELSSLPINIAYEGIQQRRSETEVPIAPFGTLHDYIPFYFAPRSPMLFAIHHGKIKGYSGGQKDIIYFISSSEVASDNKLPFVFTDGHAVMAFSEFYNQQEDLDKVDWQIMNDSFWGDTPEDPDRKRRRQAEFLVKDFMPLSCIKGIAVIDADSEKFVKKLLNEYGIPMKVSVKYEWYY